MTQEEKQLLFKDLCARLPYGVKVKCASEILTLNVNWLKVFQYHLDEIKPCLRPMSSMTEEEKKEFIHYAEYEVEESVNGRHYEYYLKDYVGTPEKPICNHNATDWLNAHHFDYRGLIPMGLALPALEGMYK